MTCRAGLTRLIWEEWQFEPSVGVAAFKEKWERAEKVAKGRLESLKHYRERPDSDFLHELDNLIAFVAIQIQDATFWRYYHPDNAMRKEGEAAGAAMERLELTIASSPLLVQLLAKVDLDGLDKESQRFATFSKRDGRRAGAFLAEDERNRFLDVSNQIQDLQRRFVSRVVEDNSHIWVDAETMAKMPLDFQDSHPKDPSTGLAKISAKGGDYGTFLQYCENDKYAEQLYKVFRSRAPGNEDDLRRLMELRYQQAKILGYSSFADYAMETGMLKDPQEARATTLKTSEIAKASCEEEKVALAKVLKARGRELKPWNCLNAEQLFLRDRFPDYNPLEARKYFPFKGVVASAMTLLGKILSVDFREVQDAETWHPTVQVYDIFDLRPGSMATGEIDFSTEDESSGTKGTRGGQSQEPVRLGRLFVDLISRDNKGSHPCASGLRLGAVGGTLVPCINLGGGMAANSDACLDYGESATLLHELGHCVHFLLAQRSPYYRFNGFQNEIDFIEVPSQLLEEVLKQPEVLKRIAVDNSGKVIPREYVNALICEDEVAKAIGSRSQNAYALCSLDLHRNLDAEGKFIGETGQVCEAIYRAHGPFGYTPGTNMQHSFEHLVDYDCRYYTYQHSLAIVKDLASKFMRCVPSDPDDIGYEYRKMILEPGSTVDATELIKRFLGREYTMEAFYRWIEDRPLDRL
ncbi:hypothetical protein QFC21_001875 [Naganishia friedmannii]|uniref:Uncharacterized protein n=1 Tax=Naganishia friedmannii TaxID=89922 RepID=A0ACC2W191_9TREE|nr:hypothetical protein QFC21_001875 [Naganishia friedmannii]